LTFSVLELLGLPLLPFVYFAKGNEKETKVLKVKKVQKDVISCSKGNCCFPDVIWVKNTKRRTGQARTQAEGLELFKIDA